MHLKGRSRLIIACISSSCLLASVLSSSSSLLASRRQIEARAPACSASSSVCAGGRCGLDGGWAAGRRAAAARGPRRAMTPGAAGGAAKGKVSRLNRACGGRWRLLLEEARRHRARMQRLTWGTVPHLDGWRRGAPAWTRLRVRPADERSCEARITRRRPGERGARGRAAPHGRRRPGELLRSHCFCMWLPNRPSPQPNRPSPCRIDPTALADARHVGCGGL